MSLERDIILPWSMATSVLLRLPWGRVARGRGRRLFIWTNAIVVAMSQPLRSQ